MVFGVGVADPQLRNQILEFLSGFFFLCLLAPTKSVDLFSQNFGSSFPFICFGSSVSRGILLSIQSCGALLFQTNLVIFLGVSGVVGCWRARAII